MIPQILAQAKGSMFDSSFLLWIVGIFAIMYFFIIRPQQKQAKDQQSMLGGLKKGDDVVTTGGILGKVFAVHPDGKVMTIEIANGVKIRILKASVQGKVTLTEEAPKSDETAKKEEK